MLNITCRDLCHMPYQHENPILPQGPPARGVCGSRVGTTSNSDFDMWCSVYHIRKERRYIYICINEIFVNIIKKGNINLIFQVTFLNIYSYRGCDINVHCSTCIIYTFFL